MNNCRYFEGKATLRREKRKSTMPEARTLGNNVNIKYKFQTIVYL
jgi:hypothetical protein